MTDLLVHTIRTCCSQQSPQELETWKRIFFLSSQKFGSNQSKPEFTVDLRGASAEWASKDKSSKKHVIEVPDSLRSGSARSFWSLVILEA